MKKIVSLIALTAILLFSACSSSSYTPKEQPHLYWKDIDVVVTDIDKQHWFATTHWYAVTITVKSEEYNLTKTLEIKGSGAFGCPEQWNYEKGQTVKAELYSWVMDSTGEVVRREIHQIY